MFSPEIVNSDAFLEMPPSTQALYFQLGMKADDDGFVNPKMVMRIMGSSEDELKVLLVKRFILPLENGVIVIKHWKINNLVRKDWYKPTIYSEYKNLLFQKENGSYTFDSQQGVPLVNEMLTARPRRLGKVSIGKDSNIYNINNNSICIDDNNIDIVASQSDAFSIKEEIKKLEDSDRRELNVIALYLEHRKPDIQTRGQFQVILKRHLKPAMSLREFNDNQIMDALDLAKKEYPKIYTLETLIKILSK